VRDELAAAYGGRSSVDVALPTNGVGEPDLLSDLAPAPEELAPRRAKFGVFFWICIGWLGILAFFAIFANLLPFQDPNNFDFTIGRDASISWHHLLGTDQDGRDVLSRLVYGARTSLIIGIFGTAIAMGVGGTLGMLSAYVRGRFDGALSFFMYCGLAFPGIIAVIAILDFWGRTEWHIILVLGLASVPLIFRLVRAATLATATKEYITAAKSQGATSFRVLFHDVFPNVAPALLAYTIFTLGGIIAVEGAIAFLGLSVTGPSWGNMISDAGGDVSVRMAFILAPAIALFLTLISLNYVGERIRVRYDPGEVKL
jgi:peptide/nickel transport system permease protein